MIVCHCHAVSDRDVRRAAREGADSVREVARVCRAAAGCGGCAPSVRQILAEELGPRSEHSDGNVLPGPELSVAAR